MTSVAVGRESAPWRAAATGLAQYETVALWSNLPTVTRLVHKYPPLGAAILVGLAIHFYAPHRIKEIP